MKNYQPMHKDVLTLYRRYLEKQKVLSLKESAILTLPDNTNLNNPIFDSAILLHNLDLSGLRLSELNLSEADLTGADLTGADLTNANLSKADLRGVRRLFAEMTILNGVNLSDANLTNANLSYAKLSNINLSCADLRGAYCLSANLTNANLSYADLSMADLHFANLTNANLSDADLSGADLSKTLEASITGADDDIRAKDVSIILNKLGKIEIIKMLGTDDKVPAINYLEDLLKRPKVQSQESRKDNIEKIITLLKEVFKTKIQSTTPSPDTETSRGVNELSNGFPRTPSEGR